MADVSVIGPLVMGVVIVFVVLMALAALFKSFYVKVDQGTALIVNDMSPVPKVHFTGAMVLPIIHKKEFMRISLITLDVDRRGADGLICRDNMRADITVAFYLRVNETAEDVLRVAKSIGAARASDKAAVDELFSAKFSEALKTVGKQIEFVELFENRIAFREKIIEVIGEDLNGYVLEDVAIDYLEQTPKKALDPTNILDAEGIKKITELTATQNVRTNILERDEELAIKKKNVETTESMLALERQEEDAKAKQEREIATIRAREEAETKKVQEEERKKAEETQIAVEQELSVQRENQKREIEVAEQNRRRAVVIEEEKVIRAQELEQVARNREVDLQTIEAEKAVEVERKEIANVIRERVVVDKSVAIEEERINEVREVSEADRRKQVQVLEAEAQAEELKVKQVKQAEARELAAKHEAIEVTTMAQAQLEAAAKEADAKKKLAEGQQAERAAPGLADAKVQEAQAIALEKEGVAQANVVIAMGNAEADAHLGTGKAEADVIAAKGDAEAQANRQIGLAEADVIREQFKAEADGLVDKFEAMGSMSTQARDHEEFRMTLETSLKEAMASIEAGKEIAKENAEVLAAALQAANIDIVGGEEHFFDNFAKSLSIGKAVDGFSQKSSTVNSILEKVMDKTFDGKADSVAKLLNKVIDGKSADSAAAKNEESVT
ncbi:Inner membrane protein YqiK [BD1-7 clade bacterium]|uniref:Inner membrane protein YqiK n=1 Tax=BD1-7 clade bacterium TaxID=2029982 RepID=A0A5S9NTP9_9GAMM|nr:Inner membrane protein YqiK [BD1-7 clade bacterium]CAA0094007.1 Inner membrane protein YqiK [BD1-7 clade bacterium]